MNSGAAFSQIRRVIDLERRCFFSVTAHLSNFSQIYTVVESERRCFFSVTAHLSNLSQIYTVAESERRCYFSYLKLGDKTSAFFANR